MDKSLATTPVIGSIMTSDEIQATLAHTDGLDHKMRSMLESKTSLLSRLFPSDLDRLIQEVKLNEFKSAADFSLRVAKMAYESKIIALEKVWNSEITKLESTLNTHVAEYVAACYGDLLDRLRGSSHDSANKLMSWHDQINTCPESKLRERMEKHYDFLIEQSFSTYESLIQKFADDLKAKKISVPESFLGGFIPK